MIFPARKILRGFTLIELLIVIAIIGILAAAVLIAINPAKRQNQAKDAVIKSDVGSITTALQAYYTSPGAGQYPTEGQGLDELRVNQDLKSIPEPPTPLVQYEYTATAGCDNIPGGTPCVEAVVYAALFDKATGTTPTWCWQSTTAKAIVVADAATCEAALAPAP